ncbi:not available [Bacillus cereus]|nr:not available [Bacillus cereus]
MHILNVILLISFYLDIIFKYFKFVNLFLVWEKIKPIEIFKIFGGACIEY